MSLNINTQVTRIKPLFDYIKKQQENRKFVKSIEISATFVLITFFLYFAVRPTVITISKLKGDIESKKILKEELKSKINQVIIAQDKFSQVQERYSVVESSLPDNPNFYEASYIIQSTGTKLNIPVNTITFDLEEHPETVLEPGLKSYSTSVVVNGSFSDLVNLSNQILKSPRTDNISSINFVGTKDTVANDSTPSATTNSKFYTTFYYWPTLNEKK